MGVAERAAGGAEWAVGLGKRAVGVVARAGGLFFMFFAERGGEVTRDEAVGGHPGGMPDGSRGLRSAARDDTPGGRAVAPASRRDARSCVEDADSGTLPGCNFLPSPTGGIASLDPPATFWHPSRMFLAGFHARIQN